MEKENPLVGKSLQDILENPELVEELDRVIVRSPFAGEGEVTLNRGELNALCARYRTSMGFQIERKVTPEADLLIKEADEKLREKLPALLLEQVTNNAACYTILGVYVILY